MKYLEELNNGNKFLYKNNCYIITCDYKNSKEGIKKLCINLKNGEGVWFYQDTIIDQIFIFYQNQENLLIEIKNEKND
jgi:hypothetical protein